MNKVSYHSKLVGVTFEGRQELIESLQGNELLRFRREPENEYDSNAVAVDVLVTQGAHYAPENDLGDFDEMWAPLGYIARDKNRELADLLSKGKEASIKITSLTGRDDGAKHLGVNVYIEHERDRVMVRPETAVLLTDIFGNEIFYDDVSHKYMNALGEVYLSGSGYASQGEEEFDGKMWAKEFVIKYGLKPEDAQRILDMWECNAIASRSFGTAVHAAIELYGKYHDLADKIDIDLKTGERKMLDKRTYKNSAMSKLPYLQEVARRFFTPERLAENAQYEVLVVDHKNKRAGRIDRLLTLEDGSFEVCDMKTNYKIGAKEKREYAKQLSFYCDIIIANGYRLGKNPIMLHFWNMGEWVDIPLEKVDTL